MCTCLRKAGQRFGVEFVLWASTVNRARAGKSKSNYAIQRRAPSLASRAQCDSCAIDGLLPKVSETTVALASNASSRDRSDLEVRSNCPGPRCWSTDRASARRSNSRFVRSICACGSQAGLYRLSQQIEVKGSGPLVIDAQLTDRDAQNEPSPSARLEPVRTVGEQKKTALALCRAGGSAIGVGVILLGFGVSAFVQTASS